MSWRAYRIAPLAVLAAAFIWWSCGDDQEAPVAPSAIDVTPQLTVLPSGGGSGAIFTTTPTGDIVNENVRYNAKKEVYLDGGPPPNAPASAAGLDEGFYVFQITDPPGKLLLSVDPARCRIVHVNDEGVIDQLMAPTDNSVTDPDGYTVAGYTGAGSDNWADTPPNGNGQFDYSQEPCHQDPNGDGTPGDDPVDVPDFSGEGRHDTNTDVDHGSDAGAIVVQMMPYGTTPNPGGVYKAWMTPIQAYVEVKGADLNAIPEDKNGKVRPHDCPDFCDDADPGFAPSHRYTKTDNFKVTEQFPAEIIVRKFDDLNGNGIWDEGEPEIGVDECVVPDGTAEGEIRDCSDPDAGGWPFDYTEPLDGGTKTQTFYTPETFIAGIAGTYTAEEFFLTDWTQSASRLDGVYLDPVQKSVSVQVAASAPGETHEIVFGNWKYSTKSGMKFHDLNANGVKDEGELGLESWTIFVDYDDDGELDAGEPSATTDSDGKYTITGIEPGTFKVREVLKDGWTCSFPNPGAPNALGVVESTACYHEETFTSGSAKTDNDFGNWTTASKTGMKFHDKNGNGQKNVGEGGLSGWTIFVDYNNDGDLDAGEPSAVTVSGGTYEITGIVPGTWKVREVLQEGWTCSYPTPCYHEETFTSGSPKADNDFGNWFPAVKSGMKFWDQNKNHAKDFGESGLEGWTIELFGTAGDGSSVFKTTTTDVDGNYEFTDLPPGSYTVCEVLDDGWAQFFPTGGADCSQYDAAHFHTHGAVGYAIILNSQDVDNDNHFGNVPLEGCTPGYWKQDQHFDSWVPTGFDPSDPLVGLFSEVSNEPYASHLADQDTGDPDVEMGAATLLQALRFGGGDTVADKAEILLRAAVASVLNSAHPDVAFGYSVQQIVDLVNAALASQDPNQILGLAGELDGANNAELGCPLN